MKKKNSLIFIDFLYSRLNNKIIKKIIKTRIFRYLLFLILNEKKIFNENQEINKLYLQKNIIYKIYYVFTQGPLKSLFKKVPNKYIEIFILNLFGFQILRIFYFETKSSVKKILNKNQNFLSDIFSKNDISNLNDEGVIKKNNVITDLEQFKLIEIFKNYKEKYLIINNQNHNQKKLILDNIENLDIHFIYKIELKIRKLICNQLNIKFIDIKPEISIFEDYYTDYKYAISDFQDVAHTDVPYKTFKGFIYLVDVDRSNGAFTYYKKTHKKLKFERLFGEYLASLKFKNDMEDFKKNYAFKFFSKSKPTYFEEKSKTLVLADTSGYHCRGSFLENGKKRLILYLNYRYLNQF